MPKRFLRLFFAVFLALTALFAGTIYVVDPYYHYHGPVAGLPLWLQDGRYQNVGAAENLDYDYLLMGTSVTANFTLEPFQQRLPGQTRKLIVQGGYFEDFLLPLDVALETHTVRQVFWGVDSNCWRRYDKENTWEAPTYLFDENLYNDVHYLLSKDTFFWYIPDILRAAREGYQADERTGGYLWGDDVQWSREVALGVYQRPEPRPAVAADALLGPAQENLDHVLARVDAHPQTTFTFYLPPYSILFWDMTIREGELEATFTMHERVLEGLISRPNVRVFYFMDDQALITDLDQYSDHIHYSPDVCQELARRLLEEEPMTAQEIASRMEAFRDFLSTYDFESLFQDAGS